MDQVLNAAKAEVGAFYIAIQPLIHQALDELNTLAVSLVSGVIGFAIIWLTPNKEL